MPSSRIQGLIGIAKVLALVVSVAFISSCKSDYPGAAAGAGASAAKAEPRPVKLVPVNEEFLGRTVVANGTLAADESATLGFKVPGRIASIAVDLGSLVHKGDVVAKLD